jgi:hypothetical protein
MPRLLLPALVALALSACADAPSVDLSVDPGAAEAAPATQADAPAAMSARPVDLTALDGAWVSTDGTVVEIQGGTATVAPGGLAPVSATSEARAGAGAAIIDVSLADGARMTFTFDGERLLDANGMPLARR